MADSARIEELRRRVQLDPASIAFAALAEEYRRSGRYEEAIEACIAGLRRHPSYLSAHVTLGRALLEVGRYDEAQDELEHVLKLAPENLAAIRGLAEIHHRRGGEGEAGAVKHEAPPRAIPEASTVPPGVPPATNALEALFDSHKPGDAPVAVGPAIHEPAAADTTAHFHSEGSADFDLVVREAHVAQQSAPRHEAISEFNPEAGEAELVPLQPQQQSVTVVNDAPALAGLEEFLSAILRVRANRSAAAR